jgi:hypothetical protein
VAHDWALNAGEQDLRLTALAAIFVDPTFETGDYHPKPDGPLDGAGTPVQATLVTLGVTNRFPTFDFTTDFDGDDWGATPSIGAYERTTGDAPDPPEPPDPPPPPDPVYPDPATTPSPANDAVDQDRDADTSWTAGAGATTHNVYFGTDATPDETELIGNQAGTTYDPGTLLWGTTYWWRIDEVNDTGTTTGSIWNFTTLAATPPDPPDYPDAATIPSPANDATNQSRNVDLSWTAGAGATSHDVYLSTDSIINAGDYQGNQAGTTYDPGQLDWKRIYYWRIDEVNADGVTQGTVWHFTVQAQTPKKWILIRK